MLHSTLCAGLELYTIETGVFQGPIEQNTEGHWHVFSFPCPPGKVAPPIDDPDSVKFRPSTGSNFSRITRALKRHNIQSVGLGISNFICSVVDNLKLKACRMYLIPSERGGVQLEQIGSSIDMWAKEQKSHVRLYNSAITRHIINLG
jgi:hypothetical protein